VRGTSRTAAALLLAALPGCVTETRGGGRDPHDAAARMGWNAPAERAPGEPEPDLAHPTFMDPPDRPSDAVVRVPAEAVEPVDLFLDNEGYLVGDRIEIDCSFEPFRTRLATVTQEPFVILEEGRTGDVVWVRLRNGVPGAAYQPERVPLATFGSHRRAAEIVDPRSGRAVGQKVRPVFEFVGTEQIEIRFHLTNERERPVWFRARAVGTASPLDPETGRDAIYMNVTRRRRVRAPELSLGLEVRRDGAGKWHPSIVDPGAEGR
jgi:hypothetical protein